MVEIKKKPTFLKLFKILQQSDSFVGAYILKDQPKKLTFKEKIFKGTRIRHVIMYHFMVIATLITTKFTLFSIIFCTSIVSICSTVQVMLINCVWNKKILINLLKWCEDLYDVPKKFKSIQSLGEKHLIKIEKQSTKVVKWYGIVMYGAFFITCILFIVLEIFLPDNILPKYHPPVPLYFPFEKQDTWFAFLVTSFAQAVLYFDGTSVLVFVFNIFFTVAFHILGYMDLINDFAREIGRELKRNVDHEIPEESSSTLDPVVLQCINDNSVQNSCERSFDDSMKIITEMISDVNGIITILSKLFSTSFLSAEIVSYATLFISGLIFTILHEQYVFATGIISVILLFWMLCFINEKILDKLTEIKETLYDIPWYGMKVKQRKTLLLVLNCDKIQKGFTVVGTHNLTMERFGIVIKSGYTNLLILKDLVQKG